ncbi:MAG TPA: rRNA maturation RNase YbeY [Chitinophagaceae bacterium]|nr:rRNA maturation RNase YbeY [Chitinophagaceae bacterium]
MPSELQKRVRFFFDGTKPALRNRNKLKQFLLFIFSSEGVELDSLNFIFSTDRALYNINKKFLSHNFLTDVVTFSLAEKGNPVMADVYISVDRVRDNALHQSESFQRELHRVIFHGALHLCGYKDKTVGQTRQIRKKEDEYLSGYFG